MGGSDVRRNRVRSSSRGVLDANEVRKRPTWNQVSEGHHFRRNHQALELVLPVALPTGWQYSLVTNWMKTYFVKRPQQYHCSATTQQCINLPVARW